MLPEYNFSNGRRGVHAHRYAEGTKVLIVESEDEAIEHDHSSRRDAQLTELAGRHLLISQLVASGIEVATPVRDKGVDLIAYHDVTGREPRFVACPIQLKSSSGEGFSLDKKYSRVSNLLLAYVWHVIDPLRASIYALTYAEALSILEAQQYTKTPSWEKGRYSVSKPGKSLVAMLERYRMNPDKWIDRIDDAVRGPKRNDR